MFNARIYRQQGGSEMTFAAGASLTFEAGAKISGTMTAGAGSEVLESGRLQTFQAGASLTYNVAGAVSNTALRVVNGTSTMSIGFGPEAPTHLATTGSLYIRANGSISGLFVAIGQDQTASSTWRAFQQGSAIG